MCLTVLSRDIRFLQPLFVITCLDFQNEPSKSSNDDTISLFVELLATT